MDPTIVDLRRVNSLETGIRNSTTYIRPMESNNEWVLSEHAASKKDESMLSNRLSATHLSFNDDKLIKQLTDLKIRYGTELRTLSQKHNDSLRKGIVNDTVKQRDKLLADKRRAVHEMSNAAENIYRIGSNRRTACKLINIERAFNIEHGQSGLSYSFLDIGGAPGEMLRYICQVLSNIPAIVYIAYGMSLVVDEKELQWNNIRDPNFRSLLGSRGDGDVTSSDNIRNVVSVISQQTHSVDSEDIPSKLNFVLADAARKTLEESDITESDMYAILAGEIITAILTLQTGGTFVMKHFETNTRISAELMHLVHVHFDTMCIFKPISSRPANSERYLVAKGFRGQQRGYDTSSLYAMLDALCKESPPKSILKYDLQDIDNPLCIYLNKINRVHTSNQIQALGYAIVACIAYDRGNKSIRLPHTYRLADLADYWHATEFVTHTPSNRTKQTYTPQIAAEFKLDRGVFDIKRLPETDPVIETLCLYLYLAFRSEVNKCIIQCKDIHRLVWTLQIKNSGNDRRNEIDRLYSISIISQWMKLEHEQTVSSSTSANSVPPILVSDPHILTDFIHMLYSRVCQLNPRADDAILNKFRNTLTVSINNVIKTFRPRIAALRSLIGKTSKVPFSVSAQIDYSRETRGKKHHFIMCKVSPTVETSHISSNEKPFLGRTSPLTLVEVAYRILSSNETTKLNSLVDTYLPTTVLSKHTSEREKRAYIIEEILLQSPSFIERLYCHAIRLFMLGDEHVMRLVAFDRFVSDKIPSHLSVDDCAFTRITSSSYYISPMADLDTPYRGGYSFKDILTDKTLDLLFSKGRLNTIVYHATYPLTSISSLGAAIFERSIQQKCEMIHAMLVYAAKRTNNTTSDKSVRQVYTAYILLPNIPSLNSLTGKLATLNISVRDVPVTATQFVNRMMGALSVHRGSAALATYGIDRGTGNNSRYTSGSESVSGGRYNKNNSSQSNLYRMLVLSTSPIQQDKSLPKSISDSNTLANYMSTHYAIEHDVFILKCVNYQRNNIVSAIMDYITDVGIESTNTKHHAAISRPVVEDMFMDEYRTAIAYDTSPKPNGASYMIPSHIDINKESLSSYSIQISDENISKLRDMIDNFVKQMHIEAGRYHDVASYHIKVESLGNEDVYKYQLMHYVNNQTDGDYTKLRSEKTGNDMTEKNPLRSLNIQPYTVSIRKYAMLRTKYIELMKTDERFDEYLALSLTRYAFLLSNYLFILTKDMSHVVNRIYSLPRSIIDLAHINVDIAGTPMTEADRFYSQIHDIDRVFGSEVSAFDHTKYQPNTRYALVLSRGNKLIYQLVHCILEALHLLKNVTFYVVVPYIRLSDNVLSYNNAMHALINASQYIYKSKVQLINQLNTRNVYEQCNIYILTNDRTQTKESNDAIIEHWLTL